ncbi:hypothetical protein Ndes2526B_g03774 [Nannochloris sp. 'desiccata']|nr:hypothetical protein KSW81_005365 [Chlorella desiccata (nom. nud.)]KAH7621425.1 hypothetical protein NADE_006688 [Chlorella desiccata (nom. nud.)]
MQGISTVVETRVAIKAASPSKINSFELSPPCFKLPRLALQSAGVAFLASTALVLTPLDASAALTITRAAPEVKTSLAARDKAMEFQCKGGMFDCDSDRRDFAKNQYKEFVKRNGGIVPEDGKASTTETANGKGKQSAASAAPTIN